MKAGTIVRLPDGREGTVVYNSLDGVGIRWGRIDVDEDVLNAGGGGLFRGAETAAEWAMIPEAMLRDPHQYGSPGMEYVGSKYEVIE